MPWIKQKEMELYNKLENKLKSSSAKDSAAMEGMAGSTGIPENINGDISSINNGSVAEDINTSPL